MQLRAEFVYSHYVSLLVTASTRKPALLAGSAPLYGLLASSILAAGPKVSARYNQLEDGESHNLADARSTRACASIHKTPQCRANRDDRRPANEAAEGRNEIRPFGINPVAVGFQATTRPDQFSLQA